MWCLVMAFVPDKSVRDAIEKELQRSTEIKQAAMILKQASDPKRGFRIPTVLLRGAIKTLARHNKHTTVRKEREALSGFSKKADKVETNMMAMQDIVGDYALDATTLLDAMKIEGDVDEEEFTTVEAYLSDVFPQRPSVKKTLILPSVPTDAVESDEDDDPPASGLPVLAAERV